MAEESKVAHKHISYFNPDVLLLEQSHQDFSAKMKSFSAGTEYANFNEFLNDDAIEFKENGEGVTYVVWNVEYDENNEEIGRDIISFYTLAANAIPYEDRIRLDEEEARETGQDYDIEICGISVIEIKMFAVAERYQDFFFEYEGEDLPISAWIMRNIIDYANSLTNDVIGFKALFLHSLPEAEEFYIKNGFHELEKNMRPLHCVDSEYRGMYFSLKDIHMNYED